MKLLSFRASLFAAVCKVHETSYDAFLDAWQDIGETVVEQRYTQGWRPKDDLDREIVAALMASGNRGEDSPITEHAGSLDG